MRKYIIINVQACTLNEKTMGGTKQNKIYFERGSGVMKTAYH
jgi:hypothetical protein